METAHILKSGIKSGLALEIGPGPGYLGLEWLKKKTSGTVLRSVEISPDIIRVARKNAVEYRLRDKVTYVEGDAHRLPFDDNGFDSVFTNGSLHEWASPSGVFNEIHRVLKPGGNYFISDLRRDMSIFVRMFLGIVVRPKEIRPGLIKCIVHRARN